MRRVVATELVSLDSIIERPEEWAASYSDDEMNEANAAFLASNLADAINRNRLQPDKRHGRRLVCLGNVHTNQEAQ